MSGAKIKIINDPVYGFITIQDPLIHQIIGHPWFQRLRRIHQMAMAPMVYPGAVHTRFHHSLGAYHLMCNAVEELKRKGTVITDEEALAVKAAILLHDIGHGPFSHALESVLAEGIHHEHFSLAIMKTLNEDFNGALDLTIQIFTNNYHKPFLHQLISSQLDMDRMDYLTRDSFYSGVSEGVIGYDRILKMLVVHDGQLMIEEKAIYSVEKFLVARRQMYWQVYLHKTVLGAEKMLVKILERAKDLHKSADKAIFTGSPLDFFLGEFDGKIAGEALHQFCLLDDHDVMYAIKKWAAHSDKVLAWLCQSMLNRHLYKTKLQSEPFQKELIQEKQAISASSWGIAMSDIHYFCFTGEASNTMYQNKDEHILILFKDGSVRDIAAVDHALIHQTLSIPVKKNYICYLTK